MTINTTDRTKLNNLAPNLDIGDVADPFLRLTVFQEIYQYLDGIINDLNAYQLAGAISTGKIADLAVTSAKLADFAVITGKLADLAVTTEKINDLAVTLAKMAANSVGSNQIVDLSVITSKIADVAVTTAKLADDAVTMAKLADASVGTMQIANSAVTGPKVADGAINSQHIDGTLLAAAASLATQAEFDKRGVNVQKYGATGGADDAATFQAAIDAASAFGGTVVLPAVTLNVKTDVIVKSGVKLLGIGAAVINLQAKLTFQGNNDCRYITFDGNLSTVGIKTAGANITFENNTVKNVKANTATQTYALHIQAGSSDVFVHNNLFDNIRPYDEVSTNGTLAYTVARAIQVEKVTKTVIENNVISNIYTATNGDAIQVQTTPIAVTGDAIFSNNYYWDYSDVYLKNNKYFNCAKTAIKLQASGVTIDGETIRSAVPILTPIRGYDIKDTHVLNVDLYLLGVQCGTVMQWQGADNLEIRNCRLYRDNTPYSSFSALSFSLDLQRIRNSRFLRNELYGYCGMTTVQNTVFEDNKWVALTSSQHVCALLDGDNVTFTKNHVSGFPYIWIRVDNTTEVTNNLYVYDNVAEVDYIFVALIATNKTNIQLISNSVIWRQTSNISLVQFGFGSQDKAQIIAKGNTPVKAFNFGVTGERPATVKFEGYKFFDTTLGKPLWWSGTAWVDLGRFVAVPATATAAGNPGDWSCDAGFLYTCHATNTWRRVAVAAW